MWVSAPGSREFTRVTCVARASLLADDRREADIHQKVDRTFLAETVQRQYPLRRGFLDAPGAEVTSANSNGTFITLTARGAATSAA